jgi:hypothetical protein
MLKPKPKGLKIKRTKFKSPTSRKLSNKFYNVKTRVKGKEKLCNIGLHLILYCNQKK